MLLDTFDPFFLFRVLRHRARIRFLPFVLGSSTSCPNSIPSFCFEFSCIVPEFNPFFLFRVLWHHARIRSLFFLGSPVSCPDSIPFFFFISGPLTSCSDSILSFVSGSPALCLDLIPFFFFFLVLWHCA